MTTEEQTSENKPGEKEISEVGVIARYEAERRKKEPGDGQGGEDFERRRVAQ